MKLFFYFQVILFCFCSYLSASPADPVVLHEKAKEYPLGLHVEVLGKVDLPPARSISFQEASSPPYDSLFYANENTFIRFKDKAPDHWIRFKVRNETDDPAVSWLLESDQWYSTIEMYVVYADGSVVRKKANTIRQELDDPHVVLKLEVPPLQEATVYLHVDGDKQNLSIWEEHTFFRYARIRDMLYSAFLAVFLIMILYNLFLFITIQDRSYLYYSLYCAGFILLQNILTGFGFQYLWPEYPWMNSIGLQALGFTNFFGFLAARSFLNVSASPSKLSYLLKFMFALSLALMVGAFLKLPFISLKGLILFSALISVSLFIVAFLVWRRGYKPARYYLLGWSFLFLSIIVYSLSVIGLIPVSLFTIHVVKVCSVIEVLLLSIGLADRINVSKREERKAQEEVIAVLQEKDKIKGAANQALEQKALELEQAYHALLESRGESAKLQELDQVKTRFFANISHEFRTPLTLILGQVEQFLKEGQMDEKVRQEYELIYRNANRLLQLINQLLELAKLEAGNLQLKAELIDVSAYLQVFTSSFTSFAENKEIQLRFTTEGSFPEAYVDKDKLEKIVGNLLSNAFKFTPAGGKVWVHLSSVGELGIPDSPGFMKIEVKDTGIGIGEDKQERVFDRFFQIDSSYTRSYSGTGIGLALVKELVKALHGEVFVQSEQGKGTCFTILLPLGKAHLQEEEIIAGPETGSAQPVRSLPENLITTEEKNSVPCQEKTVERERPLLLVVEDNKDVRSFIKQLFLADFVVLEAEDGQQGLRQALEHVPDIIISDLMMPCMDGFGLSRKLKTNPLTSHIPIILLTARANGECKIEGLETGADDYVIKPFKAHELQVRVQNLVESRRRLRKLFSKELFVKPKDIAVNSVDEQFLKRLNEVLEANFENAAFTVEGLAAELNMSRSQLHRKLSALANQSATEFMRRFRLQRAGQLLSAHYGNVADIAYRVGFNNLSYFSKCFRELYGMTPSEFSDHNAEREAPAMEC